MKENSNDSKIKQKLEQISRMAEGLKKLNYAELKLKLWELEREAALLNKFIDENISEDEYREVI